MSVIDLFKLDNQVAIVTGGGRGLGKSMALALAEAGATVNICSRKLENCDEALSEIKGIGAKARAYKCDVANESDVAGVVNKVIGEFGRVDILINNAGTSWGAPIEEMTAEQWDKVMDTNMKGTFFTCKHLGPVFKRQRKGKVINIASTAALYGMPTEIMDAIGYHASKGAVLAFSRDLAVKWGQYNINVNVICPGLIPTKMSKVIYERSKNAGFADRVPLARFGCADDIKGIALLFASSASDFITGQVVFLDGGRYIW